MTTYNVPSGVVTSGVMLDSGDFVYVSWAGRVICTTVNWGGQATASSGGAARSL